MHSMDRGLDTPSGDASDRPVACSTVLSFKTSMNDASAFLPVHDISVAMEAKIKVIKFIVDFIFQFKSYLYDRFSVLKSIT